jgi:hypothetical protein
MKRAFVAVVFVFAFLLAATSAPAQTATNLHGHITISHPDGSKADGQYVVVRAYQGFFSTPIQPISCIGDAHTVAAQDACLASLGSPRESVVANTAGDYSFSYPFQLPYGNTLLVIDTQYGVGYAYLSVNQSDITADIVSSVPEKLR